jgi:electron transport complex protein RnfE
MGSSFYLLTVSILIIMREDVWKAEQTIGKSLVNALIMGSLFILWISLVSLIREAFGTGTISLKLGEFASNIDLHDWIKDPALVFALPVGGFISIGLALALVQLFQGRPELNQNKAKAGGDHGKP